MKKFNRIFITVLVVSVLTISGLTFAKAQIDLLPNTSLATYSSLKHGFQFEYPDSWNLYTDANTSVDSADYVVLSDSLDADTRNMKIEVVVLPSDSLVLDAWVSKNIEGSPEHLQEISRTDISKVGLPGREVVISTLSGEKFIVAYFLHGDKIIILNGVDTQSKFRNDFSGLTNSFGSSKIFQE